MARGKAKKLPLLAKPREAYYPHILRSPSKTYFTPEQEREEYSRLSRMARKRLNRLGQSEFASGEVYQQYKEGFPKLADIQSPAQLHNALAEVAKFVTTARASVSGQREVNKRVLESLHEQTGISGEPLFSDIKTGADLKKFGEFMNAYKDAHPEAVKAGMYDSGAAAELYKIVSQNGLNSEMVARDIDKWVGKIEELQEIEGEYNSTSAYARALGIRVSKPSEVARRRR